MKLFWVSRIAPPGTVDRDYDRKGNFIYGSASSLLIWAADAKHAEWRARLYVGDEWRHAELKVEEVPLDNEKVITGHYPC